MLSTHGQTMKYGRVLNLEERDGLQGCYRYRVLKKACASLHSQQASAQDGADKLIMDTECNLICEQ